MNEEVINAMKAVIDGTTPTAGEWMSEDVKMEDPTISNLKREIQILSENLELKKGTVKILEAQIDTLFKVIEKLKDCGRCGY